MTHTSAVNSKKQGGRQGSGKQAVSGPFKYLSYAEESAAGENQRAQRSQSKQDLFITDIAFLTVLCPPLSGHAISAPLCRPAPVYQRKAARFTPPCGAERKACGLMRSIRCVPQHCRGLHLKMRCQAGVGHPAGCTPAPPRYPVPPASPHPRWPIRSRFPPAARFTAASAASETHRRRAKAYSRFRRGRYTSQPRASVTEADTRPPALLISSPVWARRKSPPGQAPRRAVQR